MPNRYLTYVCNLCLGKGKIEATCIKCYNMEESHLVPDECDPGGEVDCPWCVKVGKPSKVVL